MSDDFKLSPAWKQATLDFLNTFKYGDLVPHDWLVEHFGLPPIEDSAKLTVSEFKRRQFDLLSNIEAFKHELLTKHQVCLQPVRGDGYRWVTPGEQTAIAMKEFTHDAKKAFRSAGQRLRHVRIGELTDDQRRENVDAMAKLSHIRGTVRKQLR